MSLVKNFAYKSLLNFFGMILPILIMPYVYRKLSPNSIGVIEYGTSLFTYFSIFGMLGIYNYGLREISRVRNAKEEVNLIFSALFSIGVLSNLIVAVVYYTLVLFTVHDIVLKNILLILGLNFIANIFNTEWFNEAYEEFRFITIKSIIVRLFSVLIIFLLIKGDKNIYTYVIITVCVLFVNNILSFLYARKKLNLKVSIRSLSLYIAPLLWILILNNTFVLYGNLDKTLLGIYSNDAEVAYYSVANKIMSAIYTAIMVLMYVSYPKLSFYVQNDYSKYKEELSRMVQYTCCIVMPISILLFMFSEEIILLFAGEQYISTIQPLRYFSIYMIVTSFTSILNHQVMFINKKEKVSVLLFLACGLINLLGLFLFKSSLNAQLVILITLLAELLLIFSMLYYSNKKFHVYKEVISFDKLKYLFVSLLFIPIVLLLKTVSSGLFLMIMGSLLSLCLYVLILYRSKDDVITAVFSKAWNLIHNMRSNIK